MIINCQNTAFGYDGHIVIHDLNFSVEAGNFILLRGKTVPVKAL